MRSSCALTPDNPTDTPVAVTLPKHIITQNYRAATAGHLKTDLGISLFYFFYSKNNRISFPQTLSQSSTRVQWLVVIEICLTWRIIFLGTGSSRFHGEVLKRLKNRRMMKKKKKNIYNDKDEFPTQGTVRSANMLETRLIRSWASYFGQL